MCERISKTSAGDFGRRAARKRGVAAAELAVCLPMVVLIVVATIESCSAVFLKQSLTLAAYEGVRTAIAKGGSAANVQAVCSEILKDRRVQGSQVTMIPPDIGALRSGDFVSVKISAPCNLNSPLPTTFCRGRVLSTSATMMIEQ